ncbi:alpha/beta fold hydrolase [Streptomyces katsurahamanus]|uniref:Alpha/beta hydrolase n=1 Tax=Streptomyces katsurahamanus TaxID=2577098 RepID=A0ABW9P1X1_9ACTN|nr:alpha/beta hydrolase [Streptomyces katsurahamanus]MQS39371.1 alpha/beta hydrolase [Streptomyces katsurahamanus]
MPVAQINGINLGYDVYGSGEPVVMVTGTGAPGRVWRTHQVPALRRAGYQVITVDNRGIPPTDLCPEGFTLDDMAADLAALIEHLGQGPCRVIGTSLGGIILQELLLARPELISQAVLMASGGRADALITAMSAGDIELSESGSKIPPRYAAYTHALQNLSPRTLNDEEKLQDWLTVFEMSPLDPAAVRNQLGLELIPDRLPAYRRIDRPCLVIGFADDLVVRPYLSREVAEAIPGAVYTEIPGCGHYGYLERPTAVNSAIIDFFAR